MRRDAFLNTCYGFAYEECGLPAKWVCREESLSSTYWSLNGYCAKHARIVFDAMGHETDTYVRTWAPVGTDLTLFYEPSTKTRSQEERRHQSLRRWRTPRE